MASHKTLKAWQHAKTLAVDCAKAARTFPAEEQVGLADQLRRAAYSAALNIAEGCSKKGPKEFRRFLDIARASLDEVDAILEITKDLGYIPTSTLAHLEARRDEAAKTLYGLLKSVSKATEQR